MAIFLFLAGVGAVLAGVVGLFVHYHFEQNRQTNEDEDRPPARTHRRRPCKIDKALLDPLVAAFKKLYKRFIDNHWETDWPLVHEHQAEAEKLHQAHDLPGAYREYCRAMQPLMRSFHDRRRKEEVFSPIWDKPR